MTPRTLVGEATRWSLAVTLALSTVALALAMAGALAPWLAFPLVVGIAIWLARRISRKVDASISWPATVTLSTILLAVVALGVVAPHEHILTTRDSGTYVATASWLAENRTLNVMASSPVFEGVPVVYESVGFPATDDPETLKPQFLHTFPSLLALSNSMFGTHAMYWVTPSLGALGLLAMFAFAAPVVGQWGALFGVGALASSLPFLYFSRAPFSEALAFTFVFGGLWALAGALRERSLPLATVAGLLLGGVALARIDGVVVLLGLAAYRTLIDIYCSRDIADIGIVDRAFAAASALWAFSLVDSFLFSPQYLIDHGDLVASVVGAILVLRLASRLGPRARGWLSSHRQRIANVSAIAIGSYFTYAWLLRPLVESPTQSDVYGLETLQRAAGLAVEPLRSYGELSVQWLSWYLGIPIVAAGLLGIVVLFRRTILQPRSSFGAFVSVSLAVTLLFVVRPSINPDHIWAMRRFVPLVLPALAIASVWMWRRAIERLKHSTLVSALAALLVLIPVVQTSRAAGLASEFDRGVAATDSACQVLGGDAVLLFVGENAEVRLDALGPLIRGWCGIAVAREDLQRPLTDQDLGALAARAGVTDQVLWIVDDSTSVDQIAVLDAEFRYLEGTLVSAPELFQDLSIRITARPGSSP